MQRIEETQWAQIQMGQEKVLIITLDDLLSHSSLEEGGEALYEMFILVDHIHLGNHRGKKKMQFLYSRKTV